MLLPLTNLFARIDSYIDSSFAQVKGHLFVARYVPIAEGKKEFYLIHNKKRAEKER